jgi:hypothetical protein
MKRARGVGAYNQGRDGKVITFAELLDDFGALILH